MQVSRSLSASLARVIAPVVLLGTALCWVDGSAARTAFAQQDAAKPAGGDENGKVRIGFAERPKREKRLADGVLRIGTYNVENLFDQVDDPALSGEFDDMKEPTTDARCRALAKTILEIDADVLCVQEVESRECLAWFNETYLGDRRYPYIASIDAGYNRGVEQAVLSRVPIESARVYLGEDRIVTDMRDRCTDAAAKELGGSWSPPSKAPSEVFQRSPLRVDLRSATGYEMTVFVVHFKAGGRDFAQHRELEALQVEAFVSDVLAANPDANVAVLGDFNATPGDMAAKALRRSAGRAGEQGMASAYDWRAEKDNPKYRFTHASERAIDYILMSGGLAADCVGKSYYIWGTPQRPKQDWSKFPYPEGYASDHNAVTIDIATTPDRPASAFRGGSGGGEETAGTRADGASSGKSGARTDVRSDAEAPTKDDLVAHAKPEGGASKKDEALARKLRDAGWEFMLPYPKSKMAAWSKQGGNTTWWPGYWRNAKLGTTSRTQPAGDALKGDGKPAPKGDDFTKTGAPGRVSWVEWLCSDAGAPA